MRLLYDFLLVGCDLCANLGLKDKAIFDYIDVLDNVATKRLVSGHTSVRFRLLNIFKSSVKNQLPKLCQK
jgi:hypothetical protein